MENRIIGYTELEYLKKKNQKICFTNGCFDILHIGHVRCLKEAKKYGDILVVGLNSDRSVKRLKGNTRPIHSQEDRAEMLASFAFVDYVIIFDEDTPEKVIEKLQPDVWVKGGDYTAENLPGKELAERLNIRLVFIPLVAGNSTTDIIRQLSPQDSDNSNRKKVIVIGDTALDFSYFTRKSEELSAETGIPVNYVERTFYDAGGAGNLSVNLSVYGDFQVYLCGFCGDDFWAHMLKEKLLQKGVDCSALVECKNQTTYVYHRVFDENTVEQPRYDVRPNRLYGEEEEIILLKSIEKLLDSCDMVIINQQLSKGVHSDYFVTNLNTMLKARKIPVWVDTRVSPHYKGYSYKVNMKECRQATLGNTYEECVKTYWEKFIGNREEDFPRYVVSTLGENGAIAYDGKQYYRVNGIDLKAEKDTVGAGDAFLAGLCRCILLGYSFDDSLKFANAAGSASTRYLHECGHPTASEIQSIYKAVYDD